MKLLFKILGGLFALNIVLFLGTLFYLGSNLIGPSLNGTGVSFYELLKGDLTQAEYELIDQRLSEHASKLGKQTGQKIVSVLDQLLPDPDFSYSNLPPMEYPYPSLNDVVESNNDIAESGAKEALELMKSNEDEIQNAKNEGLRILQESESFNQAIKDNALSDDNN